MSFDAVVNKSGINMGRLSQSLSERKARGEHLAHILEQNGNTLQIFERDPLLEQLLREQRRQTNYSSGLGSASLRSSHSPS